MLTEKRSERLRSLEKGAGRDSIVVAGFDRDVNERLM